MIRLAKKSDKKSILHLIGEFAATVAEQQNVRFDIEKVAELVDKCIEYETVLLLEVEGKIVGGMCGLIMTSLMSNELIYQDLFFYIQKPYLGHTKSMLNELERRCKLVKINKISMATMGNRPRLDRLYERFGYSILEKHFCKEIVQ